jgi:hypothetical protein
VTSTGGSHATAPGGIVVTTTAATGAAHKPALKHKKRKLPLCAARKPKPKYHTVNGKRVKVKPKPCRPRAKTTAKVRRT